MSCFADATTEAVRLYDSPEFINTDQRLHLPPGAFLAAITASGASLSMDGKGARTDNIFIERFWRSLLVEKVYLIACATRGDAKRWLSRYIEQYNIICPHTPIGG